MANQLYRDLGGIEGREEVLLSADKVPGDIVQTADGLAAFLMGLTDLKSGKKVAAITDGIIDVASASGTTASVGAVVEYDATNKLGVAISGTFKLGTLVQAKTNGQTFMRVRINHPKTYDTQ